MIHHGDNADVMRTLERGSVSLVYMDPPFFTQRDFGAFDDRWTSFDAYVESVMARVVLGWHLLAPHGSLVLHVDPRSSHYFKVAMDGAFGRERFQDEIIWKYRRWPTAQPRFQRMHDVMLRYSRGDARWNQLFVPLSESTIRTFAGFTQSNARVDGRQVTTRVRSEVGQQSPGAYMPDVWEVPILSPAAGERTGYPTQKPVALVERLVLALTNEGDTVLDPYMGSGTTGEAALRNRRRFIGIDKGDEAIRVATARLANVRPVQTQAALFGDP